MAVVRKNGWQKVIYDAVIADAINRYKKLQGYDTFFLTGSDEHGLKIQQSAEKAGVTPLEHVNKIALETKELWKNLGITYDDETLRLIDAFNGVGLYVGCVIISQYQNQPSADKFIAKLNQLGVKSKKKKKVEDTMSAVYILQDYIDKSKQII